MTRPRNITTKRTPPYNGANSFNANSLEKPRRKHISLAQLLKAKRGKRFRRKGHQDIPVFLENVRENEKTWKSPGSLAENGKHLCALSVWICCQVQSSKRNAHAHKALQAKLWRDVLQVGNQLLTKLCVGNSKELQLAVPQFATERVSVNCKEIMQNEAKLKMSNVPSETWDVSCFEL